MDSYRTALFLHIVSLTIGIGAGATLLACLLHLRDATTLEQAVPWGALAGKVEKLFPVAVVGLFATGAYMTHEVWTFGTGWILVSIVGLAVVAVQGPLVGGRTAKQLKAALFANGPGELGEAARRMTRHPGLWVTEFTNLGLVFAVVWNMTQKPGTAEAIGALVVGYGAGTALAFRFTRSRAPEAEPAAQAAG